MDARLVRGWFKHPEYETGKWKTVVVVADDDDGAGKKAIEFWGKEPTSNLTVETVVLELGAVIDCTPPEST